MTPTERFALWALAITFAIHSLRHILVLDR